MDINYCHSPILLVEDNPVDVDLTIRAFKMRNLTNAIEIARDGEEALDWIKKWENGHQVPIVVLLDMKLPKIHGLDVLKELKNHKLYKTIPVVVLTTSSDDYDIKSAYELGANSYIIKPVNFEKFIDVASQFELYWNVINKPLLQ